jgi:hypothetical protein
VVVFCVLFAGAGLFATCNGETNVGLMANAEQVLITHIRFVEGAPAGDTVKITVRNVGSTSVAIQQGFANEIKATNITPEQGVIIQKATSLEITLIVPNGTLVYGTNQQVKLITAKGNCLVYSWTFDSKSTSTYNPLVDDTAPTPQPIQASELNPPFNLSSSEATVAAIAVTGACLITNYVIHPKNRKELFVMLFFLTIIVVFTLVAIVFPILFPPQIGLILLLEF